MLFVFLKCFGFLEVLSVLSEDPFGFLEVCWFFWQWVGASGKASGFLEVGCVLCKCFGFFESAFSFLKVLLDVFWFSGSAFGSFEVC